MILLIAKISLIKPVCLVNPIINSPLSKLFVIDLLAVKFHFLFRSRRIFYLWIFNFKIIFIQKSSINFIAFFNSVRLLFAFSE